MELDTGCPISVMTKADYHSIFKKAPVTSPVRMKLKTYTGEVITPIGTSTEKVSINNNTKYLTLVIVKNGAHPLLGREWIHKLKIKLPQSINYTSVSSDKEKVELDRILKTHSSVFQGGIGKIKDIKASFHLKNACKPKFIKARPVPYSLKEKVEAELKKLEKEGIITKVTNSEWATPIVPVTKSSGDVRICGDYKTTLNPALISESYTLPRIEDIFTNLGRGQKFTKIDLTQAYLQCELDEESKN